ncbi:MAG TPA: LAGLIDADG family homing endonuclease, partial [Candidatus Paceibacterota bacterium]|nr:LAGLIDADG family homing endonuclease [Candidatus Paceibacterota bacterium]
MRPPGKVKLEWSPEFAYAIGLIVTDGCLYNDGRHISLTSKDEEQLINFMHCLGIESRISQKRGGYLGGISLQVQPGDVAFYRFLNGIGITSRKTKTIGAVDVPDRYFFDFLRGHHDGDGTFYSYWDPRWRSSYMFYTVFLSASEQHMIWLREKINALIGIVGHMTKSGKTPMYELKYAKNE